MEELKKIISNLRVDSSDNILDGLNLINQILTDNSLIDIACEIGLLEKLESLFSVESKEILIKIFIILANITEYTEKYTYCMTNLKFPLNILKIIMGNNNFDLIENGLLIMGNMCDTNIQVRDILLELNLTDYIVIMWNKEIAITLMRVLCWVASNLCRGFPNPLFTKVQELVFGFKSDRKSVV